MKTIKQIADELGVSKQAIQKRIKREPLYTSLKPYIATIDGTLYIDTDGENIIKNAYNNGEKIQVADNVPTNLTTPKIDVSTNVHSDVYSQNHDVPDNQQDNVHTENHNVHTADNLLYSVLEKTIDELRKQLEVKDRQILELTAINKNLSESINMERKNELAETLIDSRKRLPRKKGFFSRWFSREDEDE